MLYFSEPFGRYYCFTNNLCFFLFQIYEALDVDPYCRKLNLAHRLQSISYILESYTHSSHSGPVVPMPPVQLAGQLSEL